MKIKICWILFCLPLISFGQQTSVISSADAIRIALENNLNIKIVKSNLDIAEIQNNWANAGKLPTIQANIGNTEALSNLNQVLSNGTIIKRNGVTNNIVNASLNAIWRVYNGNRVTATKERFDELEKIGTLQVEQQMQQITYEVLTTYYNIVRLNQQVKAFQSNILLSKERLNIAQARFDVGNAAKTDMLQSKIDLNEQLISLQEIQRQISSNKIALNTLMKNSAEFIFEVVDSSFKIPTIDYKNILAKLDTQNISILLAERQLAVIAKDRIIINAQKLPIVSLNSTTNYSRTIATGGLFLTNMTYGPNIGVSVSIPIFNTTAVKTQLKINAIQFRQQELQKELIQTQLKQDILVAYQDYQNAISVAEIEKKNIVIAEENNFISTERFKKLQSNLIELRQAQSSLIQAQDRYINALFKAKMAANAIQYIIGELGSE
ncbi:MAG: TolC family protein [Chitinophagaceae bacterium]|nr:TolC family protein [Chitinophagaceae bacterium]